MYISDWFPTGTTQEEVVASDEHVFIPGVH